MGKSVNGFRSRRGTFALGIVLIVLGASSVAMALFHGRLDLKAQTGPNAGNPALSAGTTGVFTPAHSSVGLAVRHFFGMRADPVQPIAFDHSAHIKKAQLDCQECHNNAAVGPRATIPGVDWCMTCHNTVATDKPVIQQVAAYFNRGEDIPWQRVYGWNDEAHVRFNHAPHVANSIQCAKCHGDVDNMRVAERVVDHTMEFCITCHKERKASIDCISCHF